MNLSDQIRMVGLGMNKLTLFYKPYALAIVSIGYILGELGHYLIGKFMHSYIDQFSNNVRL